MTQLDVGHVGFHQAKAHVGPDVLKHEVVEQIHVGLVVVLQQVAAKLRVGRPTLQVDVGIGTVVVVAEADELDASAKTTIEALDGMVGSEGKFWRTVVGYDELILILRVHLKITSDIRKESVHVDAGIEVVDVHDVRVEVDALENEVPLVILHRLAIEELGLA